MPTPMTITMTPDLATLNKNFRGVNIKGFLKEQIQKIGYLVEGEAKRVTPVDTGRLRSSIVPLSSIVDIGVVVRPTVNYAYFVHEGLGSNKRYGRRPFMEQGAEKAVKKYNQTIGKALGLHLATKIN